MGKRHKKALMSNLIILLTHLLKYKFQPNKRTISWISTIQEYSKRLNEALRKNPSLKNYLVEIFPEAYSYTKVEAL